VVVDASSIEVNRRARRAKTDRLDAGKLVTMLVRYHSGERKAWSVVRVPSGDDEDARQLHRAGAAGSKGSAKPGTSGCAGCSSSWLSRYQPIVQVLCKGLCNKKSGAALRKKSKKGGEG
jgi:hypothetical protein